MTASRDGRERGMMAGKVFVNYRRGDDPGFTQALYQRLEGAFGAENVFMDVEGHIKAGDDFVDVLREQVAAADILLVVIGPRWAELLAVRANDPEDFVAIEIVAALEQGKRVIPVLVGGAVIPRAETLPESIRPIARRNAVGLRPDRFATDCQGLISALNDQLAAAAKEHAARTEAERKAAELERRRREEEEAARLAAADERVRDQKLAGLSPEEIRKAEELASWDFIKTREEPRLLRDHLARFPTGVTTLYALTRLEELVWAKLDKDATVEALRAHLEEFPDGAHAGTARSKLAAAEKATAAQAKAEQKLAEEATAWKQIADEQDSAAFARFLELWPDGRHAAEAKARIKVLRRSTAPAAQSWVLPGAAVAGLAIAAVGGWYLIGPQSEPDPTASLRSSTPTSSIQRPISSPASVPTLPKTASAVEIPTPPPPLTRDVSWMLASAYPKAVAANGANHDEIASNIGSLSGGKIRIKAYESGTLVPAFETLEAVGKKIIDIGWAPAHYFQGRETAMAVVSGAIPMGHSPRQLVDWATGTGSSLRSRAYAPFKVEVIPCHVGGPGAEWYRKEVSGASSLKGLKVRATGLASSAAQKIGATPIALPGGEIVPAMEKGIIDAAAWGVARDQLGLNRVAKFFYYPGWHQAAVITDLFVNSEVWSSMSEAERGVLRTACRQYLASSLMAAEREERELRSMARSYPDSVTAAVRRATGEVLAEGARRSDLFRQLVDSYKYPSSP